MMLAENEEQFNEKKDEFYTLERNQEKIKYFEAILKDVWMRRVMPIGWLVNTKLHLKEITKQKLVDLVQL